MYDAAIKAAQLGATVPSVGGGKLVRTFRARYRLMRRWERLAQQRDGTRRLVWFHAPSVGEGLQARPVIDLLRANHPDVQIAYTFFSPSAESFARGLNVDMAEYLPFDSEADMRELVRLLRPRALFFSKLDVWPNMVVAARNAGVTTGLLSGTVAPRSRRLGALSQLLVKDAYNALDIVGVIDAADAARLERIGVRRSAMQITGDTRFDQVWTRAVQVNRSGDIIKALHSARPTVVAGSTWPTDERVLFRAWARVLQRVPGARLVIAPHEPTMQHVASLIGQAKLLNLSHAFLSKLLTPHGPTPFYALARNSGSESGGETLRHATPQQNEKLGSESGGETLRIALQHENDADILIIDSVGVLGDAYAVADVAYVGGGFHSAGLHSVLEPAAYGVPVLFGPGFDMSREARSLSDERGARSITNDTALADVLCGWLLDESTRIEWGARAAKMVQSGLGAAERSLRLVLQALDSNRQ